MVDVADFIGSVPANCYIAIRVVDGRIISVRDIKENEFILTFKSLIELQKLAGYKVVSPEGIEL